MSRTRNIQLGAALWGVLIGLGLAIAIAACAQGSKDARTPVAAGPDAAGARVEIDPRKQEIKERWKEIGDWRERQGLIRDPLDVLSRRDVQAIILSTVAKIRQCPTEEEPPKTDACTDVCSLRDDICDHAAAICRIADDLGDDAWARKRCNSAKTSCKQATEKCCDCQAGEK